jgi:predicted DNA-binding protein YlxM (UPF0122 family)
MELSQTQLQILEHVMLGLSISAISEKIGVSRTTIYAQMNDTAFVACLREQKAALREAIDSRVHGTADDALSTIVKASQGEKVSMPQLRASMYLLDKFTQSERDDILQRIEALECGLPLPEND